MKKKFADAVYNKAGAATQNRGKQKSNERPFQAAGLFFYGEQCGGAGPVQKRKEHGAEGGNRCPAVDGKERVQGGKAFCLHKASCGKISHQNNRQYNFIGRNAKDKGNQNNAVQTHKAGEGREKTGTMGKQAGVCNRNVGGKPDNDTGGSGRQHGAS